MASQGKLDSALREIQEYRSSNPLAEDGAVAEVQFLLQQHRLSDAADILNQALFLRPRSVPVTLLAAEVSVQLNDRDKAEQLLLHCTKEAPTRPEVWTRLGDLYLKKQPEKAIPAFAEALRLKPDNVLALAGRARAESDTQQAAKAAEDFDRAVALNQRAAHPNAMVDLLYAQFLATHDKKLESVAWYGKALHLDAGLKEAYLGRAEAAIALQQWPTAIVDLEQISTDKEYTISALSLLVKAYKGEGNLEKAADVSHQLEQRSVESDTTKSSGNKIADRLRAAANFIDEGKWDEALRVDRALLEAHPEAADAYLQSAQSEFALGRLDEAERSLRDYLSRDSNSTAAHTLLGKTLLRAGKIDTARQEFQTAQSVNPLWIEATLGLAACFLQEQKFAEAEKVLRRALGTGIPALQARLMLAECLYKQGRLNEARDQISAALAIDPTDRAALQMKAALVAAAKQ